MKEYNSSKALQEFFKVVSLSVDKGDVAYISTLEGRRVSHPCLTLSALRPICRGTGQGDPVLSLTAFRLHQTLAIASLGSACFFHMKALALCCTQ